MTTVSADGTNRPTESTPRMLSWAAVALATTTTLTAWGMRVLNTWGQEWEAGTGLLFVVSIGLLLWATLAVLVLAVRLCDPRLRGHRLAPTVRWLLALALLALLLAPGTFYGSATVHA